MYSRNRQGGEEHYRSNLPPLYSGNRFRSVRREEDGVRASDERMKGTPVRPPEPPPPLEAAPPETEGRGIAADSPAPPEAAAEKSTRTRLPAAIGDLLDGIGQEELLLITLLLLLSAEHDRAMDIIVVLLLLLGIQ